MPIVYALAVLALMGLSHYYALYALSWMLGIDRVGEGAPGNRRLVLFTFLGLATTHMLQIAALAVAFLVGEQFVWSHEVIAARTNGWWDYHYLAFMTFTTLGYGPQVIEGPIRIVVGAGALGGFMLITWSATFLYDVSRKVTDFGLEEESEADEDAEGRRRTA